jgi:DNA topoisomerase VI subunit A
MSIRMRALSNVSFNEKKRIIELGPESAVARVLQHVDGAKIHADVPCRERLQAR